MKKLAWCILAGALALAPVLADPGPSVGFSARPEVWGPGWVYGPPNYYGDFGYLWLDVGWDAGLWFGSLDIELLSFQYIGGGYGITTGVAYPLTAEGNLDLLGGLRLISYWDQWRPQAGSLSPFLGLAWSKDEWTFAFEVNVPAIVSEWDEFAGVYYTLRVWMRPWDFVNRVQSSLPSSE